MKEGIPQNKGGGRGMGGMNREVSRKCKDSYLIFRLKNQINFLRVQI